MTGNNKNSALIGAVLFHVILILILIFSTLSTPPPTFPDPEGITVDLGMDETGMGENEPLFNPDPEPVTPVTETETEPVSEPEVADNSPLTQEDDSPTEEEIRKEKELEEKKKLEKIRKEEERIKKEEERKLLEEERKKKEQEDAAKKALQDKMNKAFGQNTSGNSGSQGTAGGTGNQGKPDGVAGANNYKGGGSGNGYAWSLDGRGVRGSFPQAKTGIQAEGKVVVEILVDKQGNVIKATPGAKGSTTTNEELFRAAQEAAMRAKFTTTESDANWQKGYITYIFDLQ